MSSDVFKFSHKKKVSQSPQELWKHWINTENISKMISHFICMLGFTQSLCYSAGEYIWLAQVPACIIHDSRVLIFHITNQSTPNQRKQDNKNKVKLTVQRDYDNQKRHHKEKKMYLQKV